MHGPILSVDSYQYLSAASNLVHSGSLSTSLVHFDTERASGRMPAPLTTLAGGYSILIAGLNLAGIPLLTAGWLISAASFVALAPIFSRLAAALDLTPLAARLGLVFLIGNGLLLTYGAAEQTELPFTAVSLAALACLLRRDGALPSSLFWILGCALAGLSYWIRYAGLFTAAALFLILPFLVYRTRGRDYSRLLWLTIPVVLVGAGMARNIALTGAWQGGNTKHVSNPFLPTLRTLIASFYHLVWSERARARFGIPEAILVAAAVALAVAVSLGYPKWRFRDFNAAPTLALAIYAGIYTAGFFYLGLSSVITFGPRMFVPLIPVLVLLGCAAVSHVDRSAGQIRIWRAAVAALAIGYVAIQPRGIMAAPAVPPHLPIQARLSEPAPSGQTVEEWLKSRISPAEPVAATLGQETGYAIGRPVLSLVSPLYSTTVWNTDTVHRNMRRFGTKYLILYPGLSAGEAPEQAASPAVSAILAGHLPAWLVPAVEDQDVRVYRCLDCGAAIRR